MVWIHRPEDPPEDFLPWEGQESTPFTKAIRRALVKEAPASLRNSVMAFLYR